MSYYSILNVTPTSTDWIEEYTKITSEIVKKHGGEYIVKSQNYERLEGEAQNDPALIVMLKWPNKEAALNFENDPEYAPQLKARLEGSISHHFLVEGL